ncbi:sesquipedalian-1-like [Condylostylus longicornis]|uniref:sesquipedalian-1-like n=1 Tax=Condylostylus longicornis TaxID=2530218 RepID=UPI00244E443E|nr:sesquipedalian-1-like [Condylostylus longicornis]
MKINEKNLIRYSTTPPFDLEGWLNKRSSNNSWRKRYCVLKNNLLFYFDKKDESEPLGLIILENCTIELADEFDGLSFQIVFDNRNIYTFAAENQDILELWMKSLTSASYEYKKAMVLELQRQLNEINTQKIQNGLQNCVVQKPQPTQQQQNPFQDSPKPPPRRQNPFNRPAPPVPEGAASSVLFNQSYGNKATNTKQSQNNIVNKSVNAVNGNSSNFGGKWEIFTEESSLDVEKAFHANHFGVNNEQNYHIDRKPQPTKNMNESSENVFKTTHERFRKIILHDIGQYRKKKENRTEPLIIL